MTKEDLKAIAAGILGAILMALFWSCGYYLMCMKPAADHLRQLEIEDKGGAE